MVWHPYAAEAVQREDGGHGSLLAPEVLWANLLHRWQQDPDELQLALRRTADRVDDEMQAWRRRGSVQSVWPNREALLACIGGVSVPAPSLASN